MPIVPVYPFSNMMMPAFPRTAATMTTDKAGWWIVV